MPDVSCWSIRVPFVAILPSLTLNIKPIPSRGSLLPLPPPPHPPDLFPPYYLHFFSLRPGVYTAHLYIVTLHFISAVSYTWDSCRTSTPHTFHEHIHDRPRRVYTLYPSSLLRSSVLSILPHLIGTGLSSTWFTTSRKFVSLFPLLSSHLHQFLYPVSYFHSLRLGAHCSSHL